MERVNTEVLIELTRRASTSVFRTMLGLEIQPLEAYIEAGSPASSTGILSLIGFTGFWLGTGSLYCTGRMGCRIANAMVMADHMAVEEEVLDAVAEVTNMILGNVKTVLEESFGPMLLSIPTVLFGRNFVKRSLGRREWVVVPFACDDERLEVQTCMAPNLTPNSTRPYTRPYGVQV